MGSTWLKGPFELKQKKIKALASSEHQSLESDGHVFILFFLGLVIPSVL